MKITKKIEKEILAVMEDYWSSYLSGDFNSWASYLPDNYGNIGTTKEEIWKSKKEIMDYTDRISELVTGTAEIRNKVTQFIPYDPYIMIHEIGDMFVKAEEGWIYYAQVRLSTLLDKTKNGWKILHQHGSYPDSKTEEGEAFGFDELKIENKKLKDAIQRRTIELERKNRDLEIETAVEKVRAEAMAMHSTTDFEKVTRRLLGEMQSLNIEGFTGASICFIEDDHMMSWWDFSSPGNISDPTSLFIRYDANKFQLLGREVMEKWSEGIEYSVFDYDLERLKVAIGEWEEINIDVAKAFREAVTEGKLTHQWNPWGRFSDGLLAFDMVRPPDEDVRKITIKMTQAFEQAYTRLHDLQKAEAQAKEARIEAALETIRSRSLSVTRSDEFNDVVEVVFEKLGDLQIPVSSVTIATNPDNSKGQVVYGCGESEDGLATLKFDLPYFPNAFIDDLYLEKSKSDTGYWSKVYSVEDKNKYYDHAFLHTELKHLPEDLKEQVRNSTSYGLSAAFARNSSIMVNDFDGNILNDEQADILKRFSRVFEQAYVRFLDLQKAEAQAQEAQIEASLERVRSRSMAMHKTEELQDVIHTVHQELLKLDLSIEGGSFIAINSDIDEELCVWGSGGTANTREQILIPHFDMAFVINLMKGIKNGPGFLTEEFTQAEKKAYFSKLLKTPPWSELSKEEKKATLSSPGGYARSVAVSMHTSIIIINHNGRSFTSDQNDILRRFAKTFEQTYTRFLDLQKAEAQAREAQIEAALERVRAQSMMMQHSEELIKTSEVFHEQLCKLGIEAEFSYLWLPDEKNSEHMFWATWREEKDGQNIFNNKQVIYPLDKTEPSIIECYVAWESGQLVHINPVQPEGLKAYFDSWPELLGGVDKFKPEHFPEGLFYIDAYMRYGCFGIMIRNKISDEDEVVLARFSKEFERAYTRFLDLKKAEGQAREAQIEAALERVRAASMAMHKTDELGQVVAVLFKQFSELDLDFYQVWINIFKLEEGISNCWFSPVEGVISEPYTAVVPLGPFEETSIQSWRAGEEFSYLSWSGLKEVDAIAKSLTEMTGHPSFLEIQKKKRMDRMEIVDSNHEYGVMAMAKNDDITDCDRSILKRFTKVFEQAYTRFLDLQKAEDQAMEAQIEAALEKVRSRSLAMHQSEELGEVITIIVEQLKKLNFSVEDGVALITHVEGSKDLIEWMENPGFPTAIRFHLPYFDHPVLSDLWEAKERGENYITTRYTPEENKSFLNHIYKHSDFKNTPQDIKDHSLAAETYGYTIAFQKNTAIFINDYSGYTLTDDEIDIVLRFSKVFEQAYIRFLDLQKAEAQARESQIEAALEKIRSRTMAMDKAEELKDVVTLVVEKLKDLGVILDANGAILCTYFQDSRDVLHWIASPDFSFMGSYLLPYFDHPIFKAAWESRLSGDEYFSQSFTVEEKNSFYEYAFEHSDYKYFPKEFKEWVFQNDKHSLSFAWSENSAILIPSHTGVVPEGEDIEILKRFANVFEQAYVRFMDLQKAEHAAKETQVELSLEKIRAMVATMKESADLLDIVVAMRKEFVSLGHEAHYFWYMRWLPDIYEKAMTSGDGSKIGNVMTLPRKIHGEIQNIATWEKGNAPTVIHVMNADAAIDYVHKMIEWGDFLQVDQNVPTDDILRQIGGLTYVMARTSQGEIGYSLPGMVSDPPQEAVNTLVRFAVVFDLAYTRFEDLKEAELQSQNLLKEKNRLEHALSELKSAQTQLIHAEKMASLGELTAGIAHEIQNPLNFVNNFSEVSSEILDEIEEELEAGNVDEVRTILKDLKSNLIKITHHGHRASGIVRSMLDHSRTSSGEKVESDINALCDEYLRLAYHGMRAKDRSFNATMETTFDESLPRINVIPQDIGRVLLNLINNAFQAVSKAGDLTGFVDNKHKTNPDDPNSLNQSLTSNLTGLKPKVIVTTKILDDKIQITVSDNGPGIPDDIKEKVFQPFFTTKPTGEGTGLGLSLSYDIIKTHGGTINVQSMEGEGTTFTILLPIG